jgi:hypothetical protein
MAGFKHSHSGTVDIGGGAVLPLAVFVIGVDTVLIIFVVEEEEDDEEEDDERALDGGDDVDDVDDVDDDVDGVRGVARVANARHDTIRRKLALNIFPLF